MSLLDSMVGASFRSEQAGRVVIFPGDRRHRGYLVKSEAEELKIRSFLKMFYCAHLSILLLGYFLAFEWSRELSFALGKPYSYSFRIATSLVIYSLVVGIPYLLFWRSYKRNFLSFVSTKDEVSVSGKHAPRKLIYLGVALIALGILLAGIVWLTGLK